MTTSNEMRDRVASLIERAKLSVPSTEQTPMVAAELRKLPGVDVIDLIRVRDHEYDIRLSRLESLEDEVAALQRLAPLQLAAVPELVALIPISETQFDGALIVRYAKCPGERLVRADSTEDAFQPSAAARFRDEMKKLIAAGYVHPYAEDTYHWLVSSETGTIVLEAWGAIQAATPTSSNEMLTAIDQWLASRAA